MKNRLTQSLKKLCFRIVECVSYSFSYDPRKAAVRELCVPPASLSCFSLSANNIKLVRTEKGIAYFREMMCRQPLQEYLRHLIDDYFLLLHNEKIVDNFSQEIPIEIDFPAEVKTEFEAYVRRCQQQPDFYRNFATMADVVHRAGYSMWREGAQLTSEMLERCGFPDCPKAVRRVFPDFASFMVSGIEQYARTVHVKMGGMDTYNACRTMATKAVADALGLGRLIPESEVVHLQAGEVRMYGVLCSRCPGMRAKDAPWEPAPALQRDFADLQVLDALCYQIDHWVNNYNVEERDGRAVRAMAFDNDNVWAFFPTYRISFVSKCGGSPLLNKAGQIRLPHLSAETAQRMLACDVADLCSRVKPYLNALQRFALRIRLYRLQRALRRTVAARADFLLADDEWTEQTLQQELSGAYGCTYTCLYATTRDCCTENGAGKA